MKTTLDEKIIKKMKILIAEDNQALQKMNEQLMNHFGYDFDIVSNGKEAVEYAQKNEGKYDLCIMDIDMPIMNGLEATEIIRRKLKYFPIMAFSGNPMNKQKCLKIGMDDFLEKPCILDELLAKIHELTVKSEQLYFKNNDIYIKKEMPVDQLHAKEIRELKEKGLVRAKFGTNGEELILHKNTTNKISHDFILEGNSISVFLNHHPDKPTRCELYREHCHITQTYLDNSDYDMENTEEKEEMEKYTTRVLKSEKEKNTG